ncbi:hypothetical protein WMY93_007018 [Mugilogobius chulae]|uniref:Uncharacterized protein n=1 Tax=Mugilogobius chulae TaxID=88201 RepID=A0AAW0PLK6_9GOBI
MKCRVKASRFARDRYRCKASSWLCTRKVLDHGCPTVSGEAAAWFSLDLRGEQGTWSSPHRLCRRGGSFTLDILLPKDSEKSPECSPLTVALCGEPLCEVSLCVRCLGSVMFKNDDFTDDIECVLKIKEAFMLNPPAANQDLQKSFLKIFGASCSSPVTLDFEVFPGQLRETQSIPLCPDFPGTSVGHEHQRDPEQTPEQTNSATLLHITEQQLYSLLHFLQCDPAPCLMYKKKCQATLQKKLI